MTAQAPAEELVLHELSAGILRIVLNSPQTANAIAPEQRDRIIELFDQADTDPEVRVVVIASTGRHFCSGANVSGIGNNGAEKRVGDTMRRIMGGAQQLIAAVLDCGKPVIAAVQGPAAGLGAHLAFACDLVVAAESAAFIEAFVLRGLVVDAGGAYLLPRRIGLQKAKELAFLGDRLPAEEALALGLVNRVVPAEQLRPTVDEFAQRLAAAPTSAIALTKKLFNRSLDADRDESFLLEGMAQEMQSHAHDSSEGVAAFMERRAPRFKGW
ncbi:enoyl-CoA hydratase/isomerase family protein [Streptomyces sp. GQFP]|uniref:enoyl-CoA hydratase/isomerase family protein n=1 Tax=Streptomyces sp. GQFP TaxID=2907545 RepID=UPI001F2C0451|nr:enoyl-CoA hydratase-related protein [Streptomyces sp. GQFP]UIX29325.1 enoyl-CoA hydratase-related protein [Streptomyces sp. GQFP]